MTPRFWEAHLAPPATRPDEAAAPGRHESAAEVGGADEREGLPGRLHAVLPIIARALRDERPRSVAVSGPDADLAASCLAGLLDDCQVVPASPAVCGGRAAGVRRHDAAVCLGGLPTDQLPEVSSESPETYRRGANWAGWPSAGAVAREVACRLDEVRRQVREGGRVVLHQPLPNVSSALGLARLACEAGLRITGWAHTYLGEPAGPLPRPSGSPVLFAAAQARPAAFQEEDVLRAILPSPGKLTLRHLPLADSGGWLSRSGPEAVVYHEWVSRQARELWLQGRSGGRQLFRLRFGVEGRRLAYLYFADTHDARELKVADVRLGWPLFSAALEVLEQARRRGEADDLRPDPEGLSARLAGLLGEEGG